MRSTLFFALAVTCTLSAPATSHAEEAPTAPDRVIASLTPPRELLTLEEEPESSLPLSVAATVDVTSRCVARGIPCSTGGAVLPTLELEAFGVTASATAYLGFDPEAPQVLEELDAGVAWAGEYGGLEVGAGLTGITFPGQSDIADQLELAASLSYTLGPVTFATDHAIEVLAAPGAYYGELSVEAAAELYGALSGTASASFGWGNSAYDAALFDVSSALPQAVGGELSLSWDVGAGVALEPHAGVWYSVDARVREALAEVVLWNAGVSVAGAW